jgi:hypothetical protein
MKFPYRSLVFALVTLTVCGWHCCSFAAYYNRQSYPGQGRAGVVGSGTLMMSNSTATVYAGFDKGTGSFTDNLVMFIDSGPGGYTTTSVFSDRANPQETAISGYSVSRSIANFAPGFAADYAIVVGVNNGGGIYQLVDDGTGPYALLVRSITLNPPGDPNTPQLYWQFDWTDIGLPRGNTNFFKFETSLISQNGYRFLQSFEGITGEEGYKTITFTNYDTYGVQPIPENTTAALGVFGGVAAIISVVARIRRRAKRAEVSSPSPVG